MDSALRNGAKARAAVYQAFAAVDEVEAGYREQARAEAHAALKLASNWRVGTLVALALARAGDTAGAEKLAGEIDKAGTRHHGDPDVLAALDSGRGRPGT